MKNHPLNSFYFLLFCADSSLLLIPLPPSWYLKPTFLRKLLLVSNHPLNSFLTKTSSYSCSRLLLFTFALLLLFTLPYSCSRFLTPVHAPLLLFTLAPFSLTLPPGLRSRTSSPLLPSLTVIHTLTEVPYKQPPPHHPLTTESSSVSCKRPTLPT